VSVLIGVDVGGSTVSGGLVTPGGEILSVVRTPTRGDGSGTAVDILLRAVADLVSRARSGGHPIEGIGVGLPGPVDVEKGMMRALSSFAPEFIDVPIAERIRAETGLPAFVDNDVNALALAEWTFGRGRGASSLFLLAIGSGVGGGVVLDDRLLRGKHGFAGEIGHVPINYTGPACSCGGRGCLAMFLGGHFIAWEARDCAVREPGSRLLGLAGGDSERITSELVFQAAAAGDGLAQRMVERACLALGAGLGLVVNLFNPEVIVVTGGVVGSLVSLEKDILRRADEYAFADALANTRIHLVPSDKERTVLGGAALVLYETATAARRPDPTPAGG
jgi:glucokinase